MSWFTSIRFSAAAFAAFVLISAAGAPLSAHQMKLGDLAIGEVTSRATVGTSRPGVAYVTIFNLGTAPDRLIAAESPRAAQVGLHRSVLEGGVMKMRPVTAITIPAKGAVALKPGGYHLMLWGLNAQLNAGDRFPITLVFERAGRITLTATVESLGGGTMKPMGRPGH